MAFLLMALSKGSGLVAPQLSFFVQCPVLFDSVLFLCSGCVKCSSSAHRAPGKKATVPIYMVLANCY